MVVFCARMCSFGAPHAIRVSFAVNATLKMILDPLERYDALVFILPLEITNGWDLEPTASIPCEVHRAKPDTSQISIRWHPGSDFESPGSPQGQILEVRNMKNHFLELKKWFSNIFRKNIFVCENFVFSCFWHVFSRFSQLLAQHVVPDVVHAH